MITDENHPLMQTALVAFLESARALANRHDTITRALIDDITTLIAEHRTKAKSILGVDFPPIVMMVVPHLNILEFGHADWELPGIRRAVANFVQKHSHRDLTPIDIAAMVRAAWPQVKPGDLVDESRHVVRERARRASQEAQDRPPPSEDVS